MPGAHRKQTPVSPEKPSGRHRKPRSLSLTWRTTGGVIVGAAVLGTAAATAQAAVLPFGSAPATATAAGVTPGKKKDGGPPKKASEAAPEKREGGRQAEPKAAEPKAAAPEKPGKPRPTAAEVIKIARSQVGVEEDGGGETKFQKWYMTTARAKETVARDGGSVSGYSDAQWCDMFVSWVGEQVGFSDQIGSDAWTVEHARWFQSHGRWGTEPKPGAIVFYAWSGSKAVDDIRHVGMVIEKIDDDTIEAVEGNTGNAVKIKERSTGDVVGYGYPDYRS
ncbi:CHAP domain-containing protein [Actinomadura monticuli]|uniref:CHAP domain-containing protein n=1 Tax=Actinomadura monticuli TaxID=3097367 RepID=A0ABV4QFS8_9ACTN